MKRLPSQIENTIIKAVYENPETSVYELSKKCSIDRSSVYSVLIRLERDKYVTSYSIVINLTNNKVYRLTHKGEEIYNFLSRWDMLV